MTKSEMLDMVNKLDDDTDIVLNVQGAIFSKFYIVEGVNEETNIIQNEVTCDEIY